MLDYISDRPRGSIAGLLRPILRVRETMPADRLLAFLRERRSHHGLVEDDNGRIAGLITLEDVVAELLGGVSDEFKVARSAAILLPDGRVRLPGAMRLDQAAPVRRRLARQQRDRRRRISRSRSGGQPVPGERVTVEGVEVEIEVMEAGNDRLGDRRTCRPACRSRTHDRVHHHHRRSSS